MRTKMLATVACAIAVVGSSVRAEVTVTAIETEGGVLFQGSGTLNVDAWTFNQTLDDLSRINPSTPVVVVGPTPAVSGDLYDNPLNYVRPDDFGTGGDGFATSGSGDLFGFRQGSGLVVPAGYVSGNPLSGLATYTGESFVSLGMQFGIYTWTWGQDATADSLRLVVVDTSPQSAAVITVQQVGGDVIFEGSGALNLDDWTFIAGSFDEARINPSWPIVVVGEASLREVDVYTQPPPTYVSPDNFGTGGESFPTSGTGETWGFRGTDAISVPADYVSGELSLSSTTTYQDATLESLGIDVGTYVWSWGLGPTSSTLTLIVIDPTPTVEVSWGTIKSRYK